jgi:hypothetical protein
LAIWPLASSSTSCLAASGNTSSKSWFNSIQFNSIQFNFIYPKGNCTHWCNVACKLAALNELLSLHKAL